MIQLTVFVFLTNPVTQKLYLKNKQSAPSSDSSERLWLESLNILALFDFFLPFMNVIQIWVQCDYSFPVSLHEMNQESKHIEQICNKKNKDNQTPKY